MSFAETSRFGIAIPAIFVDQPVDRGLVRDVVQRAEELGYDSAWTQEQIVGRAATLEPISLLSYVAAVTSHIRLGVSVLVQPQRNPVQLAKSLATLDHLSAGRLIVGVGLGQKDEARATAFGISGYNRLDLFREGLEVMQALWSQPEARFDGAIWQLPGIPMEPKPLQQPRPPLWFGGRHPNALRRATMMADAWMGAGSSSTADFKGHVAQLRRYLDEQDRDPSQFTIAKRLYIAIDDDAARAEARLRTWFASYYNAADLANNVSVWGSREHCAEQIADLIDGGAQLVLLNPVFDQIEQVDALAEMVGLGRT